MADSREQRRREYENAVRNLIARAEELRIAGLDDEAVARELVFARNELKRRARHDDDPEDVRLMEARNLARYGDPLGPPPEWLFRKYGSWAAVIDAACRPARLSR